MALISQKSQLLRMLCESVPCHLGHLPFYLSQGKKKEKKCYVPSACTICQPNIL